MNHTVPTYESAAFLDVLLGADYLTVLDVLFARTVSNIAGDNALEQNNPLSILGAAVASCFFNRGHICINLHDLGGKSVQTSDTNTNLVFPETTTWLQALQKSPLVMQDSDSPAPLVLDRDGRLYLYRSWQCEQQLAKDLRDRASHPVDQRNPSDIDDPEHHLPSEENDVRTEGQRRAVAIAMNRRLTVISGGPGTGKTYVARKIVATLVEHAISAAIPLPRVALLAPTGKAARRLSDSMKTARMPQTNLTPSSSDAVQGALEGEAMTIHRALGASPGMPLRTGNPLWADVVIVDEASMIGLSLMKSLVEAVRPDARIVLLGDKNQLSSVEPGAVFGDICEAAAPRNQPRTDHTAISSCFEELTHGFRFDATSGIAILSKAVLAGHTKDALNCLRDPAIPEVELVEMHEDLTPGMFELQIEPFIGGGTLPTESSLEFLLEKFRILSAHRHGLTGFESINTIVESILRRRGLIEEGIWYPGRPIMVTKNDYENALFNGDIGITVRPSQESPAELLVCFPCNDGTFRNVAPSRIAYHDTAFAMTVHRSQGSEYDHVLIILPQRPSPVLSRELLYTAITRARKKVTVLTTLPVLRHTILTRTKRQSGLTESLLKA